MLNFISTLSLLIFIVFYFCTDMDDGLVLFKSDFSMLVCAEKQNQS